MLLPALADLAVGIVITGAGALTALVIRDAHRAGRRRVRASTLDVSTDELRSLSRLDRLDGVRRDA